MCGYYSNKYGSYITNHSNSVRINHTKINYAVDIRQLASIDRQETCLSCPFQWAFVSDSVTACFVKNSIAKSLSLLELTYILQGMSSASSFLLGFHTCLKHQLMYELYKLYS